MRLFHVLNPPNGPVFHKNITKLFGFSVESNRSFALGDVIQGETKEF
jgi:hypothetical protein